MESQNLNESPVGEPPAVQRLKAMYAHFGREMLADVPEVYSDDVVFQDPVHRIEGLSDLQAYLARTAQNITECRFTFSAVQCLPDNSAWLQWTMHYAHPRLAGGTPLSLDGATHVRYGDRIHYHRDYLDLGAMLYEHVPVVGGAVRWLKNRMGG